MINRGKLAITFRALGGWLLCRIGLHYWEHELGGGFPPTVERVRCKRCSPWRAYQPKPGVVVVRDEYEVR